MELQGDAGQGPSPRPRVIIAQPPGGKSRNHIVSMTLTVVDYRQVYFVVLNNGPIPPRCGGKFVLIADRDEQFAVFSPQGLSRFHADIVERFLSLRGVPGHYNAKGDHYDCDSADWEIQGGGHWEMDEEQGRVRIFGRSLAYGGVDLEQLRLRLCQAGGVGNCREIVVG